jgi:hypothetical protein
MNIYNVLIIVSYIAYLVRAKHLVYVNTTVVDYLVKTQICERCCQTQQVCTDDKKKKQQICTDVCVRYCDYECYDIFTVNEYHLNSVYVNSSYAQNNTDICKLKVYDNVEDFDKYYKITETIYPLGESNKLYLEIISDTCYKNGSVKRAGNNMLFTAMLCTMLSLFISFTPLNI